MASTTAVKSIIAEAPSALNLWNDLVASETFVTVSDAVPSAF